jgi:hypothetical protein
LRRSRGLAGSLCDDTVEVCSRILRTMPESQIVNVMESVEVIGVGDSSACNRLPELVCAGSTRRELAFNGLSETYFILGRENGTGFGGHHFG